MFKPWLKNYPKDIKHSIQPSTFNSLVDLYEQGFESVSAHSAFINMGKEISYSNLELKSRRISTYLQHHLKLQPGCRIAIMMPNLLQYPIVLLGILRAGMVVVNVNPLYTARELKQQLKDSGAEAIFILEHFAKTLQEVIKDTSVQHVILSKVGDELGYVKSFAINFVISYVKKMVPKFCLANVIHYKTAISLGGEGNYSRPIITQNDIAFLQYTGGTTGLSKGAMLTHGNMLASLEQADAFFGRTVKEKSEVVVTALPLYHAFALTVNCLYFMKKGCTNILITNPGDIPTFIKTLKKHSFHYITGLNTLFNALLNDDEINSVDFSRLKLTLAGGMATQERIASIWEKVTGCTIIEGYGLTECAPMVSVNLPNLKRFNNSIGLPLPGTDIQLRDDNGHLVTDYEAAGEIEIKGPQVMLGYWNNDKETKSLLHNGWLKSGDIGLFDKAGYLHLVDRKKDMIIVSGFNVYPNEIEEIVTKLGGIMEAAAIGIYDEVNGEAVKLFIVLNDSSITVEQIKTHCKQYLTAYKRPKWIEVVGKLPKNNVGKVLRRQLRNIT